MCVAMIKNVKKIPYVSIPQSRVQITWVLNETASLSQDKRMTTSLEIIGNQFLCYQAKEQLSNLQAFLAIVD